MYTHMANYVKGKLMTKFQNKMCPVCRERFHDGDDIAVCPECGTPHHRACYRIANKCSFEELHANGYVWNGRLPDEPIPVPDLSTLVKNLKEDEENERKLLDDDKKSLTLLGFTSLNDEQLEEFREAKNLDPMRELIETIRDNSKGDDGVSMQELIAYTGTSVMHYVRTFNSFRGMNEDGKKHYMSFNLFSGLFSPFYQFYRKMDLLGILATLISLIPSAYVVMNDGNAGGAAALLMNIVTLVPIVLLCLFGDYLFYLKAVRHIRKIRAGFEGRTESLEYIKALSERGKPSFARGALGLLAKIFLNACVLVLAGGLLK